MSTRIALFGPRINSANTFKVGTGVTFTLSSKTSNGDNAPFLFGRIMAAPFNAILNVNSSTSPQPVIPSLPSIPATVGLPYSVTVSATGGTPPYVFALTSGSLPPGLSLAPSTGVISGTPTTAGTYAFVLQVTDFNGSIGAQAFSITVTTPAASGGAFVFIA